MSEHTDNPAADLGALVDRVAALELDAFTNGRGGYNGGMEGLAEGLRAGIRALHERVDDLLEYRDKLSTMYLTANRRVEQLEARAVRAENLFITLNSVHNDLGRDFGRQAERIEHLEAVRVAVLKVNRRAGECVLCHANPAVDGGEHFDWCALAAATTEGPQEQGQ